VSHPPDRATLRIDRGRLLRRLEDLAAIGKQSDGSCARLALTDADRDGRDLVTMWMRDLGLQVSIDTVGNVFGRWAVGEGLPVMVGSHIDTVRTGGAFDGNYGVLAGLEVIETCQQAGYSPRRPVTVAYFTDEEGARFAPDMLGSLVFAGGMSTEEAHDTVGTDGLRLGDELARIGYLGPVPCPGQAPYAFVELHIEQGPVLDVEGIGIGAVTGVQGISWIEVTVVGQSNHAGTTPMSYRRDAGYAAARIAVKARRIALEIGGAQVVTVGKIDLHPNIVNVVAARAVLTVDLRNTNEQALQRAEAALVATLLEVAADEDVTITTRQLARFEPVVFDDRVIDLVARHAEAQGSSVLRMPSGAGHDAQMLARMCPTGMIFVPSVKGISHNPAEFTEASDLEAGANILLAVMLDLADTDVLEATR
jgi:beta-ureidopropionase / N-carbamoyl-L-amino-acid hydrolase